MDISADGLFSESKFVTSLPFSVFSTSLASEFFSTSFLSDTFFTWLSELFVSFNLFKEFTATWTNATWSFIISCVTSSDSSNWFAFWRTRSWFSIFDKSLENSANNALNSWTNSLSFSFDTIGFLASFKWPSSTESAFSFCEFSILELIDWLDNSLLLVLSLSTIVWFWDCSAAWISGLPIKNNVVPINTLAAPKWYFRIEKRCFIPYQSNDFLWCFLFIVFSFHFWN